MTRGGYGESSPQKKTRVAQKGVDSLSRRPATFPLASFYAQWIVNISPGIPGDGTVIDWAPGSFDTNHDTLFPSVDGPGLAEVFGGPEQVPVIDYAVKGALFGSGMSLAIWSFSANLHNPLRAGYHYYQQQAINVGGGGSVGFTDGMSALHWLDQAADVNVAGASESWIRKYDVDRAQFGTVGDPSAQVAQAFRYHRSNYTDTSNQQQLLQLYCHVIEVDVGIYAP